MSRDTNGPERIGVVVHTERNEIVSVDRGDGMLRGYHREEMVSAAAYDRMVAQRDEAQAQWSDAMREIDRQSQVIGDQQAVIGTQCSRADRFYKALEQARGPVSDAADGVCDCDGYYRCNGCEKRIATDADLALKIIDAALVDGEQAKSETKVWTGGDRRDAESQRRRVDVVLPATGTQRAAIISLVAASEEVSRELCAWDLITAYDAIRDAAATVPSTSDADEWPSIDQIQQRINDTDAWRGDHNARDAAHRVLNLLLTYPSGVQRFTDSKSDDQASDQPADAIDGAQHLRIVSERDQARSALKTNADRLRWALALLSRFEWWVQPIYGKDPGSCPTCRYPRHRGHESTCSLRAVLVGQTPPFLAQSVAEDGDAAFGCDSNGRKAFATPVVPPALAEVVG